MLVLFISTLDQTIVITALVKISSILVNIKAEPWIATAYLLTSAVSTLILGKMGDVYGRKIIFQVALIIFTFESLLCAIDPSMF